MYSERQELTTILDVMALVIERNIVWRCGARCCNVHCHIVL